MFLMFGGVAIIDWVVILVYLLAITAIGVWAARRVKSAASFFISDRRFGKIMMVFFAFGTGTHSDQALSFENVISGLEIFWKISAMMGIAFWVGLFWRRATVAGAWAGTLVSFGVLLFTSKISMLGMAAWDFNSRFARYLPEIFLFDGELSLPWQMIIYLSSGLAAMVVVSLLTRPVDKKQLERFHECLRTPVEAGEPEVEPFTLPADVRPARRNVIFDHFELDIPKPSPVGIAGFLASWLAVAVLIGGVYWIFTLGR